MARGGGEKSGGRGRGKGEAPPRRVMISKRLSLLLRHAAEREGLVLGEGGYACLEDVVSPCFSFSCFLCRVHLRSGGNWDCVVLLEVVVECLIVRGLCLFLVVNWDSKISDASCEP